VAVVSAQSPTDPDGPFRRYTPTGDAALSPVTATRVSELPLARGEVLLAERVPAADTDPGTEVGQVGAALNRMLGHVSSALVARPSPRPGSGPSWPTPVTSCGRR